MELGGNAPFVVQADADLDEAVAGAMVVKLRNGGSACTAANRFIVHSSIAKEFTNRFADAMRPLQVDSGLDESTNVGPLVNAKTRNKVSELVESALAVGAHAVAGGSAPDRTGYCYTPTVWPTSRRTRTSCPRRSSAPLPRCSHSTTSTRRWPWRTGPSSDWSPTSIPGTCGQVSRSPSASTAAWSASTVPSSPTRPRRSAHQAVRTRSRGRA